MGGTARMMQKWRAQVASIDLALTISESVARASVYELR